MSASQIDDTAVLCEVFRVDSKPVFDLHRRQAFRESQQYLMREADTWLTSWSSMTKWAFANCSRKFWAMKGMSSSLQKTLSRHANCAQVMLLIWYCSISGCLTPMASRCSKSGSAMVC